MYYKLYTVGYEKKPLIVHKCNSLFSVWKVTAQKIGLNYFIGFNVRNFLKFGVLIYDMI